MGSKERDNLTFEDYRQRVRFLENKLKSKNIEIDTLESALKNQQDEELRHRQEDKNTMYALLGEAVRLRRMMDTMGDDLEVYKKRAEKAERGVRNLKKWLEITGEEEPDE